MLTSLDWLLPVALTEQEWAQLSHQAQKQAQWHYSTHISNPTEVREALLTAMREAAIRPYHQVYALERVIDHLEEKLLVRQLLYPNLIHEWTRLRFQQVPANPALII